MSATRVVPDSDGTVFLETFDFRSCFAFGDFLNWLAEKLDIEFDGRAPEDSVRPIGFEWKGGPFVADWSDVRGCFVRANEESDDRLRAMQKTLMS